MMQWVKFDLLIPREFQEAVSNFLMEQGATGIEEVEDPQGVRLKVYFPRDGKEKKLVRRLDRYLKSLKNIIRQKIPCQMETAFILEEDWGQNWKQFFHPLQIGARFVVHPPWKRVLPKKGQIAIEINPGMAFGTGTHATTQLCMRVLEKRLKKGCAVLDVGTGSGILAIAAAKLGAKEIWAIDIDEVAVEGARENVERNGASGMVRLRKGGIGRIQKKFDVVLANIDFKGLKRLRMPLIRHLNERGLLILSGILREQEERLRQRYLETGQLRLLQIDRQDEWSCFTFKKIPALALKP